MTVQEIIDRRIRTGRQILFSREDDCLQALRDLTMQLPRTVVVSWALELAGETVMLLEEKYPDDLRAHQALELTWDWAKGDLKMPIARKAILACHSAAKETTNPVDIARLHAVGQACSTVHANGHAIGYPIYDLTAIVHEEAPEHREAAVLHRIEHYMQRLLYHKAFCDPSPENWASFLL